MMDDKKLRDILENHMHWINEDCDGWKSMNADLSGADLRGADLHGANLYGANLCYCILIKADLREANLEGANLHGSVLVEANLSGANLCGANLYGANLCDCNLFEADLRGANLYASRMLVDDISDEELRRFFPVCCPESGSFIGYKNVRDYIVKLQITDDAKRSSAFGRKCRCSKAVVLSIENLDGSDSQLTEIPSSYDSDFVYRLGETVEVQDFNNDRKNECAPGIHFFITRQEAVDYFF